MIPRTSPYGTDSSRDWRHELRQAITKPEELLEKLSLPKSRWLAGARQAAREFPLRVPRGFVDRMAKNNPHDPLLRQVLPLAEETREVDGYSKDPVGDLPATSEPGLIQKYQGRELLITTGACAIHCRYCFRRHYPYSDSHASGGRIQSILESVHSNPSINEIILSGGDPLMMDDEQLASTIARFSHIPHIQRIRIHSRLPIVLPERVTRTLLKILGSVKQQVVMVVHCNHPQEINQDVGRALMDMHLAGIRIMNQSVLLRGINNDCEVLANLSETLFENHVQPYYLHLLDKVQGGAHFDLPDDQARAIYRRLQSCLPGYLVPKLVREIQGMPSKSIISV